MFDSGRTKFLPGMIQRQLWWPHWADRRNPFRIQGLPECCNQVLSSPVPCVRAEASFLNGAGALGGTREATLHRLLV